MKRKVIQIKQRNLKRNTRGEKSCKFQLENLKLLHKLDVTVLIALKQPSGKIDHRLKKIQA